MALHAYPDSFPAEAVTLAVDALRNRVVDLKESAHAVWHIAGYGLSKWDVHPPVAGGATLTEEQAASLLEAAALPQAVGGFEALPWNLLLPLLLKLLERLVG